MRNSRIVIAHYLSIGSSRLTPQKGQYLTSRLHRENLIAVCMAIVWPSRARHLGQRTNMNETMAPMNPNTPMKGREPGRGPPKPIFDVRATNSQEAKAIPNPHRTRRLM